MSYPSNRNGLRDIGCQSFTDRHRPSRGGCSARHSLSDAHLPLPNAPILQGFKKPFKTHPFCRIWLELESGQNETRLRRILQKVTK